MPDNASFLQLSESINHMGILKDMPDLPDDEKEQINGYLNDLVSRQENKLDNIISLLKHCDQHIDALKKEMDEIKDTLDAWNKNKEKLVSLIKYAYQSGLIGNKLTGNKYQATIRATKGRLVDNFDEWDDDQIKEYGLIKTTSIVRMKDESVVEVKEEKLPDKARVREAIEQNESSVPGVAQIVQSCSFRYERRKRIT
jgi:hypothetical protein